MAIEKQQGNERSIDSPEDNEKFPQDLSSKEFKEDMAKEMTAGVDTYVADRTDQITKKLFNMSGKEWNESQMQMRGGHVFWTGTGEGFLGKLNKIRFSEQTGYDEAVVRYAGALLTKISWRLNVMIQFDYKDNYTAPTAQEVDELWAMIEKAEDDFNDVLEGKKKVDVNDPIFDEASDWFQKDSLKTEYPDE